MTPSDSRSADFARLLGLGLTSFVAATTVLAALAVLLRQPGLLHLAPPAALAAGIALMASESRRLGARRATLIAVAFALPLLVATCAALAACVFDVTYDGPTYHQPAVLQLAAGWNPYLEPSLPPQPWTSLWVNHYPKASWLFGAGFFALTGKLEAGKALGLILCFASLLLAFAAARAHGLRPRSAALVALVAAANPVVISQSMSFYVDGPLASCLTVLVCLAALRLTGPSPAVSLSLAGMAAFSSNLKFTSLIYTGMVFCAVAALLLWRAHRSAARASALALGAGIAFGVLGLGFNPYVTNLVGRGHPFYPLYGKGHVDIITGQAASGFLQRSRLEKLGLSLFAYGSNSIDAPPVVKPPMKLTRGELAAYEAADLRYGGFGPLFSAALLLAFGLLGLRLWKDSAPLLALFVLASLLGSVLLNPESWWARYAPQLWLVPVLVAALALAGQQRGLRVAGALLAVVLLLDAGLVAGVYARQQARRTLAMRRELATLVSESRGRGLLLRGTDPAGRRRLEEAGLTVSTAAQGDCPSPIPVPGIMLSGCFAE